MSSKNNNTPDSITINEIQSNLGTSVMGKEIKYYDELSSTNDEARRLAEAGANEGLIVIAGKQTKGRGRLGRHMT